MDRTTIRKKLNASTLVACVLVVPAIAQALNVARIVLSRATYPMDIEWLEGGELYQAYRWIHGLTVYGPPDQGYLPFTHPPGHFVVLGLVGRLFGLDYGMGRAVSIAFTTLAAAIVGREAYLHADRRGEGVLLAILAVGSALASYPVVGGIYDLIRNDAMGFGLTLAAAALALDERASWKKTLGMAALLAASCFTRLPGLFLNLWIGLFVLLRSPRRGLLLGAATAALGTLGLAALQIVSHGWFWTYTVTILSHHPLESGRLVVALRSIVSFAPFLLLLPILVVLLAMRGRASRRSVLWTGLLVAAFPAALLPFAKLGGFDNDLAPLVFLAGPVAIFLVYDLTRGPWGRFAALGAAAVWLTWRSFDPASFVPTAEARGRAARLNAFIAQLDGGVIIPNHPFLPIRNGQRVPQLHTMPYLDVISAGLGGGLRPYIRATHAKWAILDGREPLVRENVISLYDYAGPVPDAVSTMVGYPSTTRLLFKWREPIAKPDLRVLFDFEGGAYDGWTLTGNAFAMGPLSGDSIGLPAIVGVEGRGIATSYVPASGDVAKGRITSPPILLDRSHLAFLVGGGGDQATSVELIVDGRTVERATGPGCDALVPIVWDVSSYRGRQAQIAIVDDDAGPAGHILVDQIELFN